MVAIGVVTGDRVRNLRSSRGPLQHGFGGDVGLPVVAFVSLSVTPGKIPEVAVELAKMDCVVEVHQIHNSGDLLVKIRAEDLGDLGETLANRVRRVADVDMVDAVSVLKVWKDAPA